MVTTAMSVNLAMISLGALGRARRIAEHNVVLLAEAVRLTKSLDQAKLRTTLAEMETESVLGGYKVDPQSGEQRAARPAVVQIQRGKPQVVWPEWLQTATLQPYPQWSERRTLE